MSENLTPMQQELLNRADQVMAAIGSAINSTVGLVTKAGNAVAQELPDIAIQYVMYGRAYSTVFTLIGLAFIVLGVYLIVSIGVKNIYNMGGEARSFTAIIGGGINIVIGTTTIFSNISEFLLVWLAPKVWLITQLAQLIKAIK